MWLGKTFVFHDFQSIGFYFGSVSKIWGKIINAVLKFRQRYIYNVKESNINSQEKSLFVHVQST